MPRSFPAARRQLGGMVLPDARQALDRRARAQEEMMANLRGVGKPITYEDDNPRLRLAADRAARRADDSPAHRRDRQRLAERGLVHPVLPALAQLSAEVPGRAAR